MSNEKEVLNLLAEYERVLRELLNYLNLNRFLRTKTNVLSDELESENPV
jgi:hypothetical protein